MLIHLKTMTVTLALIAGIGLSPTESEHSPRTPEFRAVEIQAEAVLSFGSDDMGVENMKIARASELLNGFRVNEGFLFVRGKYCDASTKLSWRNNQLQIENPTSSMLAFAAPVRNEISTYSDSSATLEEICAIDSVEIAESEMLQIQRTLRDGGIVALSDNQSPFMLELSKGGYEFLEGFTHDPGPERDSFLNSAYSFAGIKPEPAMQTWLSELKPDTNLTRRATQLVNRVHTIEKANILAATAVQRFESWSYPITIIAMVVFVFSMGTLLTVRPHELVAVARTETETSVAKFLWLIAGMSAIDLVWTLLAHQANHITEVNPVGGVMLNEPSRVILFKVLATTLAIGILYRGRSSLFARKACWWTCLTLALLMARWILVTGVSA